MKCVYGIVFDVYIVCVICVGYNIYICSYMCVCDVLVTVW